jgi:hypothetical protein
MWGWAAGLGEVVILFFSEEKNQKTFVHWSHAPSLGSLHQPRSAPKSLLGSFSSEKELFLTSSTH